MDVILFLVFALFAVACAINVVVQTHPIASAISLIGVMASLAVLYLLLGAEFIAAAQVIVYAGAIMVLFVFVIMLAFPRWSPCWEFWLSSCSACFRASPRRISEASPEEPRRPLEKRSSPPIYCPSRRPQS